MTVLTSAVNNLCQQCNLLSSLWADQWAVFEADCVPALMQRLIVFQQLLFEHKSGNDIH